MTSRLILLSISLCIIGLSQPKEAKAEQGEFIVRVHATDVTTEIAPYRVTVTAADGTTKSIVQNPRRYTGTVPSTIFTFDANTTGRLAFIANTVAVYKD